MKPAAVKSVVHVASGRTLRFRATDKTVVLDLPFDFALDPYADAFAVR